MDIKRFVQDMVLSSVGQANFDLKQLTDGIDAYTDDNGFPALDCKFDEEIIKKVISNNLSGQLSRTAEEIVLYFSNYRLIEQVRLINNKALRLAKDRYHGQNLGDAENVADIEEQFENCLREIYKIDGLHQMLQVQLSEIILNLDYAKKESEGLGQRMRDIEVSGK